MYLSSHGSIRTLRQDMQESVDGKTYQGVETVEEKVLWPLLRRNYNSSGLNVSFY